MNSLTVTLISAVWPELSLTVTLAVPFATPFIVIVVPDRVAAAMEGLSTETV